MSHLKLHTSPYISNTFLSRFTEIVICRRGDMGRICELAGLPTTAVTLENQLIPLDKFVRLLTIAEEELHCPELALIMAQRQDVTILGPISVMLYESKTFADALNTITKYMRLIITGLEVEVIEHDDFVSLTFNCYRTDLFDNAQFQIYVLASTATVLRQIICEKLILRGCFCNLPLLKNYQNEKFVEFFQSPVSFNSGRVALTFNKSYMTQSYEDSMEAITSKINKVTTSTEDLINQVCKSIIFCLPSGKVSLEIVSKSLGYSKSTLHRKLIESSTSFRALLDSVRLSHANEYLKSSHYSLTDIAYLLGYKNQSAFTRSYLRWTGILPSDARHANTHSMSLIETRGAAS